MGGSHLAADIVKSVYPTLRIIVHRDYGLPRIPEEDLQKCLFIASSYSGNTEEVIDGLEEARKKGMASAAISVGGNLEEFAQSYELPHIKLPDTGIQPRSALGFSAIALMKLLGMDAEISEMRALETNLQDERIEKQGKELAKSIEGKIPIIYSSERNLAVGYNWKIKCNETGKIPAFCNVFPELNHNEMTGFDITEKTVSLSELFYVVLLRDTQDDPRIQKRMDICKELYIKRGIAVADALLEGTTRWERVFRSLLTADWFSYYTGTAYSVETEQVPMVEEFKKAVISSKL